MPISHVGTSGSAADAARPIENKSTGRSRGRKTSKVKGETKGAKTAKEVLKKEKQLSIPPAELKGKVKQEFDFLNGRLYSNVGMRARKNKDGSISLRIKFPSKKHVESLAKQLPADVTGMIGQYLDAKEKRVAVTGMPEMKSRLGVEPLPSPKELRKVAEKNAKKIQSEWLDKITRQTLTSLPPTTQTAWVVLSLNGEVKAIHEGWEAAPTVPDRVVRMYCNQRFKDIDAETLKFMDSHPQFFTNTDIDTLKENDSKLQWTVDNFEDIDDQNVQAVLGLTLDYLNLAAANRQIENAA